MKKFVQECDMPQKHMIVGKNMLKGRSMNNGYIQHETMQNGMKVILEVPEQSEDDEVAKEEVRKILTTVLNEYLHKIS